MKAKWLAVLMIVPMMVLGLCACSEETSTANDLEFQNLVFSMDDSWWIESFDDRIDKCDEQEDKDYLKRQSRDTDEYLVESAILDQEDLPEWCFLYCAEIAGSDYLNSVEAIKENWKGIDCKEMKEFEIDGVPALKIIYENTEDEDNTFDEVYIYIIAGGYSYSIETFRRAGDEDEMDEYIDTIIDSITIKEDTSSSSFSLKNVTFSLPGKWKTDTDNEYTLKDDDENLIDVESLDSPDGESWINFMVYDGDMFSLDNFRTESEAAEDTVETTTVNNDYVGEYAVTYWQGTGDCEGTYYVDVLIEYGDYDYYIRYVTSSLDKAEEFGDQLEDTLKTTD